MGSGWLRCSGGDAGQFYQSARTVLAWGPFSPWDTKNWTPSTHRQSVEIVAQYAVAVKKDFLTIQIFQKSVILRWKELGYNAANLLFWMALLTVLLLLRQVPELATGSLKSFPNDSLKGIILDPFPGGFWLPPAHGRGARSYPVLPERANRDWDGYGLAQRQRDSQ